jgi:hypothetical protein
LSDAALDAAMPLIKPGGSEADILASPCRARCSPAAETIPANEFIIGSGEDALLCRYKSGRRQLEANDQLTLEWAGVFAHYHAADDAHGDPRRADGASRRTLRGLPALAGRHHRPFSSREPPFGEVFDAHSEVMDERGLTRHRLNACGYSVGARFTPSWMEHQMFHTGNPLEIIPGHDAVRAHDHHGFRNQHGHDPRSDLSDHRWMRRIPLSAKLDHRRLSDLIRHPVPVGNKVWGPPSCKPVLSIDRSAPGIS